MADIFISHVEADGDVSLQIALSLEAAGYTTWYYERDSLPGLPYLLQVGGGIEEAGAVCVLVSEKSIESDQVTNEIVRAYECRKPIVPILHGMTHASLQKRQPVWRQAFGAATSIALPPGPEGVGMIAARLAAGLGALDIRARRAGGQSTPKVEVVITDRSVIDLGAEGICYSANDRLILGGGVARALLLAAGQGLQDEASALLEETGAYEVGACAITGSHGLRSKGCERVFHLVTLRVDPDAGTYLLPEPGEDRERELQSAIAGAVARACSHARELGLRSLAFPLMGTRVAGIPIEVAVAAAVGGARDSFASSRSAGCSLETLYFSHFRSERAGEALLRELSLPENAAWVSRVRR